MADAGHTAAHPEVDQHGAGTGSPADPFPQASSNPLTVPLAMLRQRTSEKWRRYGPDVLPLWVAEMDTVTPAPVVSAITRALELGDTGYQHGSRYQEAFASIATERWNWDIAVNRTALFCDVMNGVMGVVDAVVPQGGAVYTNAPGYPPLLNYATATGRQTVHVPLTAAGRLDLQLLDAAFSSGRRSAASSAASSTAGSAPGGAFLLCNPHNPTGVRHTRTELTALAELTARYGIALISDEIHAPLTYDAPYVPILTVTDTAYAAVSASKAWNLAGFKAAIVVAGASAPVALTEVAPNLRGAAGQMAVLAHSVAIEECQGWLDSLISSLDQRRRLVASLVTEHLPGAEYRLPEATYLGWIDFRAVLDATGSSLGDEPSKFFLRKAQVALSPGGAFAGPGFARVNFATSPEVLTEAFQRLGQALR